MWRYELPALLLREHRLLARLEVPFAIGVSASGHVGVVVKTTEGELLWRLDVVTTRRAQICWSSA